ncbi:hypothetical protein [Thalassospira sp. A3_1]|uniref:hypothetical protein n=1 Tax=Thalassospira sp. A3_1 TaxID=2821088 RepID=UPI001ADA55D9|nr:hypothetical protein [Thalassospira sp. A3_1]MBO9508457.1 hypothetical protein [Thalassospira sp. A3_1]
MTFRLTDRTKRRLFLVAVTALVVATIADGSRRFVADLIWADDAAPWEKVTAVYYPDIQKETDIRISDARFDDVAECRAHIGELSSENGDPDLKKGRYECAIGFYRDGTGEGSYRLIVR